MEYRLIETEYRNRIEYEDGPGSLQNIVSDESRRLVGEGTIREGASKEEMTSRVQHLIPYQGQDYGLGMYDYSYTLEAREKGATEWEYVDTLHYVEPEIDWNWLDEIGK